jgi:hypothetical protein
MEILIYCELDEGTLIRMHERFEGELEKRGLTKKDGARNTWICGDCFSAAEEALESVSEAAATCGVVVKRAFALADEPNELNQPTA